MNRYAISDIHGCCRSFEALLDRIALTTADELYLLGDFIDRGPDSKGVFDLIFRLRKEGYQVHCLRGNHDQMLLNAFKDYKALQMWMVNGGEQTADSFNAYLLEDIPSTYIHFLEELPYHFESGEYLMAHAGFDCRLANPMENTTAMMWIRRWYDQLDRDWLGDRIIIHGHTPCTQQQILDHLAKVDELPIIVIDNGCVYQRPGMHQLCAFDLNNRRFFFQPNVESK
ncbi:MAG: metallophosphoesterase family protein [Bacteroidota bacterium]